MDMLTDNLFTALNNVSNKLKDNLYQNLDSDYLDILERVEKRGYAVFQEMEYLKEIYDMLDSSIQFYSEYNSDISYYI